MQSGVHPPIAGVSWPDDIFHYGYIKLLTRAIFLIFEQPAHPYLARKFACHFSRSFLIKSPPATFQSLGNLHLNFLIHRKTARLFHVEHFPKQTAQLHKCNHQKTDQTQTILAWSFVLKPVYILPIAPVTQNCSTWNRKPLKTKNP